MTERAGAGPPDPAQRCGRVALVGPPNAGKSTLLNRLIGQKLSITAHRPQTTRHQILGIHTEGPLQALYLDTPGLHDDRRTALNRLLNRWANAALEEADVVVLVIAAAQRPGEAERALIERLRDSDADWLIALNKIDRITPRSALLPLLQRLGELAPGVEIVPVAAISGDNVERLQSRILARLPRAPHRYPPDQLTDRSERFLAAEIVREQLTRLLAQELPYAVTVAIERFEDTGRRLEIDGVIWVDRDSQKGIIIGKGGAQLGEIGRRAREAMQHLFANKVHLQLWVKVKQGWADDERALRRLGYDTD